MKVTLFKNEQESWIALSPFISNQHVTAVVTLTQYRINDIIEHPQKAREIIECCENLYNHLKEIGSFEEIYPEATGVFAEDSRWICDDFI